jgi:ABC-type sugar transport system ATPase subunit
MTSADPVLEVRGLCKAYGGVQALRGIDWGARAGEVHAVVGENGAGKSTLMGILSGLVRPDSGEVRYRGEAVEFEAPHAALRAGIHLVHQERMPFRELTVAENLYAGQELAGRWPGLLDRRRMRTEAARLLARLGWSLDVGRRMGGLTVAQMQGVEIARGLAHDVRVLILDEPTSALSPPEARRLFEVVDALRRGGVLVVYITHKLEEVYRLADRVTVLRDGVCRLTSEARAVGLGGLIQQMVGRELEGKLGSGVAGRGRSCGERLLAVEGLSRRGAFEDVTFEVHRGEVVGLAGLVGAGRTELVEALYGGVRSDAGRVQFEGRVLRAREPREALEAGLALVTEDRQHSGVVGNLSVQANLTLSALGRCCAGWWIRASMERRMAGEWIDELRVKTAGPCQSVTELSGGNQQKVLLGRALMTRPRLLILDEPTRGIDVGAKAEIYALIECWRAAGLGILLVSSELSELLALSDRILVMREGRICGELGAAEATEERVLARLFGRSGGVAGGETDGGGEGVRA